MASAAPSREAIPAIEFREVAMSFGSKLVFEGVSFRLGQGETLFLLGVTGTGKSVMLKLTLGLLKPDSGQILINGRDIVPLAEEELAPIRKQMGIVFQEGALFDSLSVYDNVAYRLHEEGERDERKIEQQVREVLSFVEMEEAIDRMPAELSGGMRRRVSVARAIISEPSIMLYDSPTGGLDPVTAHAINVLIAKLRDVRGVTSVVVSQRIQTAYFLVNFVYSAEKGGLVPVGQNGGSRRVSATRFLVLRDGGAYFQGDDKEFRQARDPYLRRFLE